MSDDWNIVCPDTDPQPGNPPRPSGGLEGFELLSAWMRGLTTGYAEGAYAARNGAQLGVICDPTLGVCLMGFELGEQPPGFVAKAKDVAGSEGYCYTWYQDTGVGYPEWGFMTIERAEEIIRFFMDTERRSPAIEWVPFEHANLDFIYP